MDKTLLSCMFKIPNPLSKKLSLQAKTVFFSSILSFKQRFQSNKRAKHKTAHTLRKNAGNAFLFKRFLCLFVFFSINSSFLSPSFICLFFFSFRLFLSYFLRSRAKIACVKVSPLEEKVCHFFLFFFLDRYSSLSRVFSPRAKSGVKKGYLHRMIR